MTTNEILEKVKESKELYVIGPAGCGKTTTIKSCTNEHEILYWAPTNGMAKQLPNGQTYHSAIGWRQEVLDPNDKYLLNLKLATLVRKINSRIKYIYLDEISMVNSLEDEFLTRLIHLYNKTTGHNLHFIKGGDPCQIPPVKGKPFYYREDFDKIPKINLRDVKRQNDPLWINCLNQFRIGDPNALVNNFRNLGGIITSELTEILNYKRIIVGTNKVKDGLNILCTKQHAHQHKVKIYEMNSCKDNLIPICKGMKITFRKNHNSDDYSFSNGESASIKDIHEIDIDHLDIIIEKNDGSQIPIQASLSTKIPFEGGYATTSHGVQGSTIRNGKILIVLDNYQTIWRTPGSAYNALSRTVSPSQIDIFTKSIDSLKTICTVDNKALQYV